MASQLDGKVVIVTGSSGGLGESIALTCASRGASVTICGRDEARLKSVLEKAVEISGGHSDRFLTVQGDLNDKLVRKQIIEQTVKKFGRLDVLVPNAGVASIYNAFLDETEESYNNVMDTNLKSVFFLIQEAVPHLEKTKGNIITISSIATSMVVPSATVYSFGKVALDHLTRCLAVDLGSKGIRVNSVNPGYFATLILRHIEGYEVFGKQLEEAARAGQPLKEKVGVPKDVAEAVVFLASDAAGFITGEHVKVDGGRNFVGAQPW